MVEPVSRSEAALLLSVMLISAAAACGILNLFLKPGGGWSLYVAAAAVTLWIWFVLPLLIRGMPMFLRLTLDVFAIGLYVYLVSIDLNGSEWFYGLALPIILLAGVISFVLGFFLNLKHISILSSIALLIGAAGLVAGGSDGMCGLARAAAGHPPHAVPTGRSAPPVPLVSISRLIRYREILP